MSARFSKGDIVETPVGVGEIISNIEITGRCIVKLDKPAEGGDDDGKIEIVANTLQMRHMV